MSSTSASSDAKAAAPTMQFKRLGNTGLKVSRICLGCMTYGSPSWQKWVLDEAVSSPFIERALSLGINFFDTADVYSHGASETVLGNTLKRLKVKREDVVIATKVFFPAVATPGPNARGLSRKHILEACDASLARLQMSYIDLYQIHRWDNETPIEETMEALNDLVRSGKVRYIGASSMFAWQFAKAQAIAKARGWAQFVSMQNHYNLAYREEEREMNPLCADQGVGLIPWSPLAGGFLVGNRKPGERKTSAPSEFKGTLPPAAADAPSTEEEAKAKGFASMRTATDLFAPVFFYQPHDFAVVDKLKEVAARLSRPPAQVALAWLLAKGVTAPIIGASKFSHLDDAVAALSITLSPEDIKELESAYKPHAIIGHA